MRTPLAPKTPRIASWTWVWLALGLLLAPRMTFSQTTKGGEPAKGGSTKASAADDAAKKDAPEKKGMVEAKAKRKVEPVEIFDDPRATEAAADLRIRELFPNARLQANDDQQFDAMASGAVAADRDLIVRYIRYQVNELTRRSNIQALANLSSRPEPAKKIADATEKLVKPFLVASNPQTEGFRRAYVPELVGVALAQKDPLIKNHLYARNAILIVLKESTDAGAFPVYRAVLKDPEQVLALKISACEGITKAALKGRASIGGPDGASMAEALHQFLSGEPDTFWWAQWNALHALGALRQATSRPAQGKPEIAELALRFLADPKAKLDVRAYAGWALGMMQLPPQVKSYNYPLVAWQISQVAAEIGEEIAKVRRTDLPKAQHLTKLLVLLVEGLAGDPDTALRNSGIVYADQNAVAPFIEKVKAVAVAAVEYDRAAGVQMAGRLQKLNAAVADLKATVNGKVPKNRSLVPGAEPIAIADVAAPEPSK
jgi:hypothetical protein